MGGKGSEIGFICFTRSRFKRKDAKTAKAQGAKVRLEGIGRGWQVLAGGGKVVAGVGRVLATFGRVWPGTGRVILVARYQWVAAYFCVFGRGPESGRFFLKSFFMLNKLKQT